MSAQDLETLNAALRRRWPRIIADIRVGLLPVHPKILRVVDGYSMLPCMPLPNTYSAALTRRWMRNMNNSLAQ